MFFDIIYYGYLIGVVAQLVRSPPCQGGSCGFEPRQSRKKNTKKTRKITIIKKEREGCEPSIVIHYAGFQDRSLQPLDHLSKIDELQVYYKLNTDFFLVLLYKKIISTIDVQSIYALYIYGR